MLVRDKRDVLEVNTQRMTHRNVETSTKGRVRRKGSSLCRHVKSRFLTRQAGFHCDVCLAAAPQGAELWGCRRCDFDVCRTCRLIALDEKVPPARGDAKFLESLFEKHADTDNTNCISDAYADFLSAVGLAPDGVGSLWFAWKIDAKTLGEVTKSEFVKGLDAVGIESLSTLKRWAAGHTRELASKASFAKFYNWAFVYVKSDSVRKSLDVSVAKAAWEVLLKGRFAFMDEWMTFLDTKKPAKITRDVWSMVYEFSNEYKDNLDGYDPNQGAWPTILDDFCEWMGEEEGKNAPLATNGEQ